MNKPMTKPQTVTQATFDLAIEVRNWLSTFGQGATMQVDPNNDHQMWVLPEFGMNDMQDFGVDVFDLPTVDGASADWYNDGVIVIQSDFDDPRWVNAAYVSFSPKEPMNEDDHDHFGTAHIVPARPLQPINLNF